MLPIQLQKGEFEHERGAHLPKFSFSKNHRDLKNIFFFIFANTFFTLKNNRPKKILKFK